MARTPPMPTIIDVLNDPVLFRDLFPATTWQAWRAFLAAVFGLPMPPAAEAVCRRWTGRSRVPQRPAREAWVIVGRRGGKSRITALLAVYVACFRDYRRTLTQGERGVVMLIASDRKQARVLKGYVAGLLRAVPMLARLIEHETTESLTLTNRVVIEVHTASFRAVRGYTVVAAILDEIAFWPVEDAANPDTEILTALRPAMATVPGALLVAISSPYARRGELWRAYRDHFGRDDDPVLVWQADTLTMNPTVPPHVIAAAYEADEASAAAEYGAQFRRDVDAFVPRDAVEACVIPGRRELAPAPQTRYWAFVDPSGGAQDSFTLAIAHHEPGLAVLDLVREVTPPLSPEQTVATFADLLRSYGITSVSGDRYAGEWPRERFRAHGVRYEPAERPKSDLYRDLLPLVNSGRVALLDHPRLIAQLCGLERRTARGGRDSIDHAPGQHDDVINAAAGALVLAHTQGARQAVAHLWWGPDPSPASAGEPASREPAPEDRQLRRVYGPWLGAPADLPLTCAMCGGFDPTTGTCRTRRLVTQATYPACEAYEVTPEEVTP